MEKLALAARAITRTPVQKREVQGGCQRLCESFLGSKGVTRTPDKRDPLLRIERLAVSWV